MSFLRDVQRNEDRVVQNVLPDAEAQQQKSVTIRSVPLANVVFVSGKSIIFVGINDEKKFISMWTLQIFSYISSENVDFDERGFVHFPDVKRKEINKLDAGICLVRSCGRSFDSNVLKCHVSIAVWLTLYYSRITLNKY